MTTCPVCDTPMPSRSKGRERKTCSHRCAAIRGNEARWSGREAPPMTTCPVCEESMQSWANGRPRTVCSVRCAGALGIEVQRAARADFAEEVEFLASQGQSPAAILRALNTNATALSKRLYRAGRHDLARPFDRLRRKAAA